MSGPLWNEVEQSMANHDSQDWLDQAILEVYETESESHNSSRKAQLKPGAWSEVSLSNQGLSRKYEVYVPKNSDGKTPMPLIMMVHGTTLPGHVDSLAEQSNMNALADQHGFAIVYPIAHPRPVFGGLVEVNSWNTSGLNIMERDNRYDDIQFLDHVLDDVSTRLPIDAARVSAMGHSAGGMLVQRYQLERPGRLASIASVSGTVLVDSKMQALRVPKEQAGIPVLIIHGGDDLVLPYSGGSKIAWLGNGTFDGANNSLPYLQKALWAKLNDCEKTPRVILSNNVEVSKFEKCAAGPVLEYRISDHGHGYPRRIEYSRSSVDSSEIITSFLLSHRLDTKQ